MTTKLNLLVPLEALPAEGADFDLEAHAAEASNPRELLGRYLSLAGESPIQYAVDAEKILASGENPAAAELQHAVFSKNGDTRFDFSAATTRLDLAPPEAAELPVAEDASPAPDDLLRHFLDHFRDRIRDAAGPFSGAALPLLTSARHPDSDAGAIVLRFHGILLAEDDLLESLRDDATAGQSDALDLILEEAEVEGQGVREIVASLTVLGVVFAGAAPAEAGFFDDLFGGGKNKTEQAQPRHLRADVDHHLLAATGSNQTQVIIDVSKQRAYVVINGKVAIDTPCSTARTGKYTPRGEFHITQRVRTGKTSTIYGCDLPYWMRLDQSAIGLHVGELPGYPASAGCVRLPSNIAPLIFDNTQSGTTVKIVDAWAGPSQAPMYCGLALRGLPRHERRK